jgi:hypothetical protein
MSTHLLSPQKLHASACAQSVHSHRPSKSAHLIDLATGMSARKVLVTQLCCLGKRSNCSADNMETPLGRKQQQFPGSDAANEDDMRSSGLAAASSFTRNGRRQSATEQRELGREVAHHQCRRQNCKKGMRRTGQVFSYRLDRGHFTVLVTASAVTHTGSLLKLLKH